MANPDKTWSYPKAAATKRELNVADRNTTSSDRKSPADALASRRYGHCLSFVTVCNVLSRFVAFIPFYYVLKSRSSAPWLPWQIF